MTKFDPYDEWLDISPAEQPADYYRLLGVPAFETDLDRIRNEADERMAEVRRHQNGKHAKLSQMLLNDLSAARGCLLDQKLRRIYDAKLRKIFEAQRLPHLEAPQDLLPHIEIPDGYDPFFGTADVDHDHDPLRPHPARPVWPYVAASITIILLTIGIIYLIFSKNF